MARQFFGTDGIRGRVNQKPMTVETALRLSIAAARTFAPDGGRDVIIGRDTRRSGEMIEAALVAGLCSMGLTPVCVGVVPTPAVALLTRETGAAFGVMVTASHNKYQDNGLKLFSPEGIKFTDAVEEQLETAMFDAFEGSYAAPTDVAKPRQMDDGVRRYVDRCLEAIEPDDGFAKLNVVLDCAHGAAYRAGPDALRRLGCNVTVMGVSPDGVNINAGVGSTDTKALMKAVTDSKADIGIAFDGDADRLIVIDELGEEVDGDQVMALIATELFHTGRLKGGGMVATVMSNMGLAEYLKSLGLTLPRTKVGDRYVAEHMRAHGFNLGGEQSGHIILSDVSTTGDGLLAALQVLKVMARTGKKASVLGRVFEPAPQELVNIRYAGTNPLETERVKSAIARAEANMGEKGRLVVRKSGTEPLIRVMAEALEEAMMKEALAEVVEAVQAEA
ncbi:phosphoglucosamine mutase [Hyphomonas jannaschiana]|uniref:Phosphoglucosamine mutase n=1 Tax=Hyphomonas jannaschiana VP2 TaxID=1280952 RepID=A0A059F6E6_9PROT|nr:phosphoglucosamine mutase [Hyphomonas jannaschiana]KCZ83847.1 phosphoglucosamine mutase [Hyphomonas jannaschiana VP2]